MERRLSKQAQTKNSLMVKNRIITRQNRNYIRRNIGVLTGPNMEEFLVDIDVFHKVKNCCWFDNGKGYAQSFYNGEKVYLHRIVLPNVIEVDHINRDTKDNRRVNLRDGKKNGVNGLNKNIDSSNTHSKIRGIYKMRDKWQVRILSREKRIYIGTFGSIKIAKQNLIEYAKNNGLSEFYN